MSTITSTDGTADRRLERLEDQPRRTDTSHALFVGPRGREDGFRASIRGHVIELADPSSGHELAPTPDDLLILSIAAELAWSGRKLLRAQGLPDDVTVCATWRTPEDRPGMAELDLTVTVSRRAEAVRAALAAAFESRLAARSVANPAVHISLDG